MGTVFSCSLIALGSLLLCAPGARAALPIVDGEIRAVAVAGDRVVAVRGGDVVVLTAAGRILSVLDRDRGAEPARAARRRPSAEEVLELAGLRDDDLESDEAADALDDEGLGGGAGRHRVSLDDGARAAAGRRGNGAATPPHLLAASRGAVWIAGLAGLLRLDAGEGPASLSRPAVPIGPRHLGLSALAAGPDGAALAALAGNHLLRSSDGGRSWMLLAILAARPRAVEISAAGDEVFILDDDGVAVVAHRQRIPIFEGRAYQLARCGDELLILGGEGVYGWSWDRGLDKRSERLPARRLVCSDAVPGLVIALGADLLVSWDGGRTFSRRADLSLGDSEIQSLAIAPDRLWIGRAQGLYVASLAEPRETSAPPAAPSLGSAAALSFPRAPPLPSTRSILWQELLPRVSVVVSASTTRPGGDRGAVWMLLTFPLGRRRARAGDDARRAAELLQRRAARIAELIGLARSSAGPESAADSEERAALARVAREELDEEPR